ncbi:helicase-related protein [Sphingomonas aurantiaca]|uniref:helicase-related protein n=1 Tax=Sphingomonas aurantiaca TaxID=185949 RepID=UPI003A5B98A9
MRNRWPSRWTTTTRIWTPLPSATKRSRRRCLPASPTTRLIVSTSLIVLADQIVVETKIAAIVDLIDRELPPGESVLLFTEYKATQALVVNALQASFGFGSAAFINGDERLDNVLDEAGRTRARKWQREAAAASFNGGERRFLVSTEAAGEGIDLQQRCATLIHVDMPWNPMRLHQRVGRLSRYGQKRPVSVYILRNPETVEARIWGLLNAKLERIQQALGSVMENGEDISQLVVGMSGGPTSRTSLQKPRWPPARAPGSMVRSSHSDARRRRHRRAGQEYARQRLQVRLPTGGQGPAPSRSPGPGALLYRCYRTARAPGLQAG